ncbi:MAG: efflux RND transporter periplasmic adaptor subunit [Polyangiaceae bacterium]|nr:efflux RND transporter periplasmic adaptor subunit [Polyangiaceae bacterium]
MNGRWSWLLALLFCACAQREEAPRVMAESSPKSAETPWVAARAPEGLSLLEAPAETLPPAGAKAAVSPSFAAKVLKVHVEHGQEVAENAAIADVVMPELGRAAGAYMAASTRLSAQSKRKAQLESLRKEGLTRLSEIAEVDSAMANALADQQIALATLKIAGLGPKDASSLAASGGKMTLKSPIGGIVTEVDAVLGETREPSSPPIARVERAGSARVEARFSQKPPANAGYVFVGPLGQTIALKLLSEAPSVSGRDGAVAAWFEAREPIALPHGTLGKVRVVPDPKGGAVAVPAAAVKLEGGKPVVVLRKTGDVLPVKVLSTSGADAIVEGGLGIGDEVAADASLALALRGDKPAGGGVE